MKVKKTLIFHHALLDTLKNKYTNSKKELDKRRFCNIFAHNILKKYQCLTRLKNELSHQIGRGQPAIDKRGRTRFRCKFDETIRSKVVEFLEREDNSRMTAGKKETITKEKVKRQKMFLKDTMTNLHAKLLSEYPSNQMSFATFCRLRPFWIRFPTLKDREVCICKIHDNSSLMFEKLKSLDVIHKDRNVEDVLPSICCDVRNRDCAYGICNVCKAKIITVNENIDSSQQVEWFIWKKAVEERYSKKKREQVEYDVTAKIKEYGTIEHLIEFFQESVVKLAKHVYNIRTQFRELRKLRQDLGPTEVVIHMDFSENYTCRYAREITSVHFGASTKSASLHDGIIDIKDQRLSFCTISDSIQHDAQAIWAHLEPLLKYIREKFPEKTTLHCISDSPSSQYRGRRNFYLLTTLPFDLGFIKIMWHFLEAGHGKGPADGIGASIKRSGDKMIANGIDIPDADTLFSRLTESRLNAPSKIIMFFVAEKEIDKYSTMPDTIPTYKGTMNVHQVYSEKKLEMHCRPISFFCKGTDIFCSCYNPGCITYPSLDIVQGKDQISTVPAARQKNPTTNEAVQTPSSTNEASAVNGLSAGGRDDFVVSDDFVGRWCVIAYDNKPYPAQDGLLLSPEPFLKSTAPSMKWETFD